ncbi:MAG: hypothetical protein Q9169_005744 [Polycauliona sp. 2 TL-2023]
MIPSFLATIAISTALLTSSVRAVPASMDLSPRSKKTDGINKEGSSNCFFKGTVNIINNLNKAVDLIANNTVFTAGEQIACIPHGDCDFLSCDGFCASLCENTPTATSVTSYKADDEIRNILSPNAKTTFGDVIGDLRWNGAQICGTAPIVRDGSNMNSKGCITVNYVTTHCQPFENGLCK